MQNYNLDLIIGLLCIISNVITIGLFIIHRKYPNSFNVKLFWIIYFGNLILNTIFLNIIIHLSQQTAIILFEIIEIIILQIFLIIYLKVIRHREASFSFLLFSSFLFGVFRLSGTYYLLKIILSEEMFLEVSFFSVFFFELFYIFIISLFSIFILSLFNRIFSNTTNYRYIFTFIWASIFIFGISRFVDLLLYNSGITPYFNTPVSSLIGQNLFSIETYGTITLFSLIAIILITGSIIISLKYGFKFMPEMKSSLLKAILRYFLIGIIVLAMVGVWYCFIVFVDIFIPIVSEITRMFEFVFYDLSQPFISLAIIYLILLIIPFYCGYLLYIIIKQRNILWSQPNEFNKLPILNIIAVVFIGFILCYYEFEQVSPYYHLDHSFVLFSIYFYLITFLFLLTLYGLTYVKKSWINISYSLKLLCLYCPFILGYLLAGQILSITEVLFGLISCAALQVYALYLKTIKLKPNDTTSLNLLVIFFWGVISLCFAGLLSITSMICLSISLISFYLIYKPIKRQNLRVVLYALISSSIILMAGISSTFTTTLYAMGIPNTIVFGVAFILIIATIFYGYLHS